MSQKLPEILDDVSAMYRTNYMGFASFTILIWDHVDTFAAEVEYIWKGKKGLLVYLFLLNRYLTPLGFIVNLFAYLSTVWTPEVCSRFIRFEGSMTVIGINVVAMMMYLRVRALYSGNYWIQGVVIFIFLFQLCMNAWLLTRGVAVMHNPDSHVRACTMIFDPSISVLASSSAWLPLLYDTVVFGLTLHRTRTSLKNSNASYVMRRLLEDGLIYYGAIFAVTAVLTIMIIAAPPGLKNITAQLELLLTVAMMSRITLNLKKSVHKVKDTAIRPDMPSYFSQARSHMSVGDDIRIVSPGYNQTTTMNSIDFGVSMAMEDLRKGNPGGKALESRVVTIITPPKKHRAALSPISQETSEWDWPVLTHVVPDEERGHRDRVFDDSDEQIQAMGTARVQRDNELSWPRQ